MTPRSSGDDGRQDAVVPPGESGTASEVLEARPKVRRGDAAFCFISSAGWILASLSAILVYLLVSYAVLALAEGWALARGLSYGDLDINLLQVAMQLSMLGVAFAWWRWLYPRSFACRWRGERRFAGGAAGVAKRIALVVVAGLALQVFIGYVCDAVLAFFPQAAAEYQTMVEETGLGSTELLAIVTTVIGAPFSEELLLRGVVFELALRAFNPQCRVLWKRRRVCTDDAALVRRPAAYRAGVVAALVLQAAVFGILHFNVVQSGYAFVAGLALGAMLVITGSLRYTILLHFSFNAGSYLMGLLWFVDTPAEAAVAVAVAAAVFAWALGELRRQICG